MFAHLYENTILKNPKSIFVLLLVALISFGYFTKDFRLDASSETLLIDGDPDLKYLEEISKRYGSKDFLILTYTPKDGMVTDTSINKLLSLKYKIQSLNWVHIVVTFLDVPLLKRSGTLQVLCANTRHANKLGKTHTHTHTYQKNVYSKPLPVSRRRSAGSAPSAPVSRSVSAGCRSVTRLGEVGGKYFLMAVSWYVSI